MNVALRARSIAAGSNRRSPVTRRRRVNAPAVLDSTGRWLGRLRLPRRFQPLDVVRDYVLAIRRISLAAQFVELDPLRR